MANALLEKNLFAPGHTACSGCGEALGMKLLMEALGPNVIIANATGCSEIFTTRYPQSAWRVPWIHSLFENSSAVASGIESALKAMGREGEARVVNIGGDGALADIGMGPFSGMLERGHDILTILLDNEAYMNTGIQRSSMTPLGASTTTSPSGKESLGSDTNKKDMIDIAIAHRAKYVATATVAYPMDLKKKVQKAMEIKGPRFIHFLVPCPLGWRFPSNTTIKISKLAVQTGMFPLVEFENGKLIKATPIGKKVPIEDYLKPQGRFKHLFNQEGGKVDIERLQRYADANIEKYGLIKS
ncbi:MAG: thiamine pyrophosphate-dependent enzyme [Armatimonadota bacterium]